VQVCLKVVFCQVRREEERKGGRKRWRETYVFIYFFSSFHVHCYYRLSFNEHDRSGHGEEGLHKLLHQVKQRDKNRRNRVNTYSCTLPPCILPSFLPHSLNTYSYYLPPPSLPPSHPLTD